MFTANAYSATSANEPLAPATVQRREVGPHDVHIEIKYCGICHSDIHHVRSEWGPVDYPVAPGHEIAGIVTQVGEKVTKFAVGDKAGVGCLVDSCRECANCRAGREQFCVQGGGTLTFGSVDKDGNPTQGGYTTDIVVDENYTLKLPDTLPLEQAAPLLCAGITTYSPLRKWGAGEGKKVAVIGLGGLGHMAVKLAHAMGAEVTVLSQSLKKREDGLRLGAHHYRATSDPATFTELAGSFDLIINTVSAKLDLDTYLPLLTVDGAMVNVGAPAEPLSLSVFSLIMGNRSYAGSLIGSIAETQEMLDFCGTYGIGAEVEVVPADKINEAYERVLASDIRYRFVIDIDTMR
ncbi:NAD(P)-dependent alcohol dehydrogenase [Streptomyces sp. AcE210]|uniref:NAD(P)-dependent alcohol dehydrogenase n=1 Tax=Streptomyces sp. AcE210 TaxID=2292703 RepID=UPI000E3098A0|nr:NAD(P)-dependent alcohol dehydrogenase [Streptomyces sp. AcE210]RFC77525.1 NAD(P)-dependent alcohol dehydrogenase [Streptomyces sp. AcE210]